jgi:branched-subunit amino acid transport protein AzlD
MRSYLVKRSIKVIYAILIGFLCIALFYLIFTEGNPNSIFRYLIKNPSYDYLIALVLGLILSFIILSYRWLTERVNFERIIQENIEFMRKLRKQKKSDGEIADSLLAALNIRKGIRYNIAKKKILYYLSAVK